MITTSTDTLGKYTKITLGDMCADHATTFKAKLHGKSYMDFQVVLAPEGGGRVVSVETRHDSTPEEICAELMRVMARELGV